MVSDGKQITKDFSVLNKYEMTQQGKKVAFIGLGTFYSLAVGAAAELEKKTGVKPTVINPYYITGTDEQMLEELKKEHDVIVTIEDGILDGGFGEKIARFYGDSAIKVLNFGLKKEFPDRYDVDEMLKKNHLTKELILTDIMNNL
jgi:1-deoxy-D-xylulose-5-phosphate synthase